MASTRPSRARGGSQSSQRIPSSTVPIPEAPEHPTSDAPISPSLGRRTSSVHFSEEAMSRSPPMERRHRRTSSSEEIIPIRYADSHNNRNYNTNTSTNGHDSPPDTATEAPGEEHTNGGTTPSSKDSEEQMSWYKSFAEKYGSVTLENKGSVARDHLALERTFLAWLRTSLAFASIGIAITQLFRLNTSIASRSQQQYQSRSVGFQGVPFSPMVGHSIPFEVMQVLQAAMEDNAQPPPAGPDSTLLDQLLNPRPRQVSMNSRDLLHTSAANDDAAAKLRHVGKPLGATFLGVSIVVLFVGFHRYFESQHWIIRGKFPASRGSVALVGFIAGTLIVTSLVVVLVIAPTSFEKK